MWIENYRPSDRQPVRICFWICFCTNPNVYVPKAWNLDLRHTNLCLDVYSIMSLRRSPLLPRSIHSDCNQFDATCTIVVKSLNISHVQVCQCLECSTCVQSAPGSLHVANYLSVTSEMIRCFCHDKYILYVCLVRVWVHLLLKLVTC